MYRGQWHNSALRCCKACFVTIFGFLAQVDYCTVRTLRIHAELKNSVFSLLLGNNGDTQSLGRLFPVQ